MKTTSDELHLRFAYPAVSPQGVYEIRTDESGLDRHVKALYFEGALLPAEPFIEELFEGKPDLYAEVMKYADFYARQKTLHTFLTENANTHLRRINEKNAT